MAEITNRIENFQMFVNEEFVEKARKLEPRLHHQRTSPIRLVRFAPGDDYKLISHEPIDHMPEKYLSKGDSVCADFGSHQVGNLTFTLRPAGSPPDAPAHIRIKLGEMPCEIAEDSSSYSGSISSSWIQEEFLHIDVLPAAIALPRRYAFRYVEIRVLDTSPKYQVAVEGMTCDTVTSGDRSRIAPLPDDLPDDLKRIDAIALKTMEDCMQSVFEDGPKRDRRLWIGDLRLQALTNYETFQNYDLVKRCLYLFAGLTQNEGHVGACLFLKPSLLVDDTSLFDYGLFFISCLHDFFHATHDHQLLAELWPTAYHQAELAVRRMDTHGVVKDSEDWWCFLDWKDGLNKQAGAQGVLIYTMKQALSMAGALADERASRQLEVWIHKASEGALSRLWDEEQGFFISGEARQVSWASQIWLVLAGVLSEDRNQSLLDHLIEVNPPVGMVTPYMYHHFIDALLQNGRKERALEYIRYYWGQMADDGADCFWELYDPENKGLSPYGSPIINSYCHAWSCTPSYFIRRYFLTDGR